MYHTTMIMQDSQSLLNTSFFKSVMFSLTTVASTYNSRLAWKAEKHILIKALFVGNGLNVQTLVDTLIRGRQTTHEGNV